MHSFCRKQDLNLFAWIIVLALLLRSFVAPGFMLDTSSGTGLAIIFCNGPAGQYAPVSDYTNHHANHHGPDSGTRHHNHITPTCSHWSTSSMLVFDSCAEIKPLDTVLTDNVPQYVTALFIESVDSGQYTRGPPPLSAD